jgi:hypothetical protein
VGESEILADGQNFTFMANPNKKGGTQFDRPLETSFIVWVLGFFCNEVIEAAIKATIQFSLR